MKRFRKLFNFILFIGIQCITSFVSVNAQNYGLKFYGHDVTLDRRTELDLTPKRLLDFKEEFEISFEYKPDYKHGDPFGYIFRIVNKNDVNIDLLSTPTPNNQLNIVIGNTNSILHGPDISDYNEKWLNIRVKFNLLEDKIIWYTPDSFYVHNNIGFNKQEEVKIIFGANNYKQFKTTDVPSMSIKNIKLYEKGKLKYHWALSLREGTIVKDKIRNAEATVNNPSWLMLNHQTWQTELEEEFDGDVQIAYDINNGLVYILSQNNYQIFKALDKSLETYNYKQKPEFFNSSYKAIYNETDNKIYSYVVDSSWPTFSFDVSSGEWDNTEFVTDESSVFRHHNSYFDVNDNSILSFGGYGLHSYNNIVRKIDLNTSNKIDIETDSPIYKPRYLAGLGVLNDTVYIFGGYGSESGNQLINPHSYYDLIGYSLKTGTFFKKFEVPHVIDDMVVGSSIFIDSKTRNFYALVFEKSLFDGYLQLTKGSLDSPELESVGNTIPFQFLDIRSSADLFYIKEQNKLYAYNIYLTESGKTQLAIHSISFPPDQLNLSVLPINEGKYWPWILLLIVVFGIAVIVLLIRKKTIKPQVGSVSDDFLKQPLISDLVSEIETIKYHIIFFGGFQVFNKEYKDITNKFSPLLKELFLLIILNTLRNNKGISSEKITEILWFDKSEKSARNNRAVNTARLRTILSEIGNCELSKKTGYWKILFEDDSVKSDYIDFIEISTLKNNQTRDNILRLLQIAKKGAFLQNVQYSWLDEYKASVSETIIDTLVNYAYSCEINKESEFIIQLADSISNFDLVNEDAMILKCRAEYCMGKHSMAKSTYLKFYKEYKLMYGQDYDRTFLDILDLKDI